MAVAETSRSNPSIRQNMLTSSPKVYGREYKAPGGRPAATHPLEEPPAGGLMRKNTRQALCMLLLLGTPVRAFTLKVTTCSDIGRAVVLNNHGKGVTENKHLADLTQCALFFPSDAP